MPHYSKGELGRKPVGLDIMLRVFLQQWFALSKPAVEDALYELPVLRRFAGVKRIAGTAWAQLASCYRLCTAGRFICRILLYSEFMRLFTGIALDDKTAQSLHSYVSSFHREFPALRWSLPQQWHVTLQFLGEAKEECYTSIVQHLRTVRADAAEIRIGGPAFFERAGVFHIEIEKTESLLALHYQTEQALAYCGFKPEVRPYSPHITLAHNKGRASSADFKRLRHVVEKLFPAKLSVFTAHEFLLYQSFTEPSGSRYEVRERFPLM